MRSFRIRWLSFVSIMLCGSAFAQSAASDVLSGKLVRPEKGVWAWYDLKESSSEKEFLVRIAVVDEEKVGSKAGFWLEMEVVPLVGYRSVYKMLVTGPADNPDNVHRLIQRDGTAPPQEVSLEKADKPKGKQKKDESRKSQRSLVGKEQVETQDGQIEAEHYILQGDEKADIWLNDEVRPMGVVRMVSSSGVLSLRNYGKGGENARSVMDEKVPTEPNVDEPEVKVEVRVEKPESTSPAEAKK